MLLTGRLDPAPGAVLTKAPGPNEWPSIASQVTYHTQGRNNLPPAIVLPQPSVNEAGQVRPGQYAGRMGPRARRLRGLAFVPEERLGRGAVPPVTLAESSTTGMR